MAAAILLTCLLAASVNAQPPDPRIGEWRQDRDSPNPLGLYQIFEQLENGMSRYHNAANLALQNRLYSDYRCDGNFHPIQDAQGVPTDITWSCVVVDAHTVTFKAVRNPNPAPGQRKMEGSFEGEGTGTISSDGNHYTTVFNEKEGDRVITTTRRTYTRNAEICLNAKEELFRECLTRTSPPRK